ncbi:GTPase HflX [bacterium]|nr:GTPase HflX [bacterium]NBX77872.1 GTPase HflX [bacterium]
MTKPIATTTNYEHKALLIAVQAPYNRTQYIESYFEEFVNLAKTLGVDHYEILYVKLRDIDNKYFFSKGKLLDLQQFVQGFPDIDHIYVSEPLAPQQERHLKDLLNKDVTDRTGLILSIFERSAITAEGKTQVEIARLEFEKTRLAGKGIHLAQQAGQIGVKGPGETLKEKTKQVLEDNILKLKRRLKDFLQIRETQRKQRINNQVPHICLVGYTNAGKSTILNLLTHSNVLAEDKLFATLDTTTRQLYINHEKMGVISDTVGFIQQLPHQLIEAFKSTLSELQYADLLLHVVDISDPNWKTHIDVVLDTLAEIGVSKEMLFVFNKSDKLPEEELQNRINSFGFFAPFVAVSSLEKQGAQPLINYIFEWKQKHNESK